MVGSTAEGHNQQTLFAQTLQHGLQRQAFNKIRQRLHKHGGNVVCVACWVDPQQYYD
jgi:hypothetical protein